MKNGYTLIEVLIALLIFMIVASIIPQIVSIIQPTQPKLIQSVENFLFFQQLSEEIQQAAQITITNNTLYLRKQNNETVSYSYLNSRVRRQVNNTGQEIVLQNVQSIFFQQWKNGVNVAVKDIFGQEQNRRITHLLPLEEMKYE